MSTPQSVCSTRSSTRTASTCRASRDELRGAVAPPRRPDRRDAQGDAPGLRPCAIARGGQPGLDAGRPGAAVRRDPAFGARTQRLADGRVLRRAPGLDRPARQDHHGTTAVAATARRGGLGDLGGDGGAGPSDAGGRRPAGPGRESAHRRRRDPVGGARPDDDANELACYVDSERGVELLETVLREEAPPRPLPVLLELGHAGGRTGCRGAEEALAIARRVATSPNLLLAGLAGYEGTIAHDRGTAALDEVRRYLADLRALGTRLREQRSPVLGVVRERRRQRLLRSRGRRARRWSIGGRDAGGAPCRGVRRARRRDVRALVAVRAPIGRGPVPQRDRGVGRRALHAGGRARDRRPGTS